ncbi:MAG: GNAT family N-acetyltransferase [Marinirhabdus sp.]
MKISIKKFKELTHRELHDLFQLRSEVFVVEQDCVYQDIDGRDKNALHVLCVKNEKLIAYARCLPPDGPCAQAAIGRVVVVATARKQGYGHNIMEVAIGAIKNTFGTNSIKLSAQTYLVAFYEKHGFKALGEQYLEDGIPHIAMGRS